MDPREQLRAKAVTAETAAGLVKSGNWIDYAGSILEPELFDQALASACLGQRGSTSAIAGALAKACEHIDLSVSLAGMSVLVVTLLLYWPQFARGLADVGFVGASLRGERGRRWGV